jgi:hypothetical protein
MTVPGKPFQIAAAMALAGIVAGALAGGRQPVASAPVAAKPEFGSRWESLSADEEPLLKKSDRLALADANAAPIRSERVVPSPSPAKPLIMVQTADDERPVSPRHRRLDVCERHGMRRVVTHGGRSWRCRR